MKSIFHVVCFAICCLALTAMAFASPAPIHQGNAQLSSPTHVAPTSAKRSLDPALGFGELVTSAPLSISCSDYDTFCEEHGTRGEICLDPNGPSVCRCVAFGTCAIP